MYSFEHDDHFFHGDKINFKSVRFDLGPFLPSAAIGADGCCRRPLRPSVVHLSVRLPAQNDVPALTL